MANLGIESLDMSNQESKIYILLLALGPLSLGEIIKNSGFSSADTENSLDELKRKGYIHQIPGVAFRYTALLPFDDLKTSAETTISHLESLATQLDDHIAKKLEVILGKMREESQKMTEGLKAAQTSINQIEMKAEGDVDARIARYTLEVDQLTDETKSNINKTFETKQTSHQSLVSNLKGLSEQKTNDIGAKFRNSNQQFLEKYQADINELQTSEDERNSSLKNQIESLTSQSQDSLTQGIQNVHQSMDTTGQTLLQSIEKQNEKLNTYISDATTGIASQITKVTEENQQKVVSSLEECNTKLHEQFNVGKQDAVGAFSSTRDEIQSKTIGITQNIQQAINENLVAAQNQLIMMLQEAQETLTQKTADARIQVEKSMKEFEEAIKVQTDSDTQKIIINTESTFGSLAQDAQTTYETTREEVTNTFNGITTSTKEKTEEIKGAALLELSRIVETLKTEINSHLDQFKETMVPQAQFLKDELTKFQTEVTTSRTNALDNFNNKIEGLKTSLNTNHQEIESLITQETNSLLESINQFTGDLNDQLKEYDSEFSTILSDSAVKGSEILSAKTLELKEKIVAVVNETSNNATNQLDATSQLITSSIDAEINTLDTELSDYTTKFKESTKQNEDAFKNYLFTLNKVISLITETKRPEVQTAPIVSRDAVLDYLNSMFSRVKSGITLLVPDVSEIPNDMILATKNHQRVKLASVMDKTTHSDLLKRLFAKPNVHIRSIDLTRFPEAENYIAADRDGEEVLIGISEDRGETVAIVSFADSFVKLMGQTIIGGDIMARSTEIKRSDVGM